MVHIVQTRIQRPLSCREYLVKRAKGLALCLEVDVRVDLHRSLGLALVVARLTAVAVELVEASLMSYALLCLLFLGVDAQT